MGLDIAVIAGITALIGALGALLASLKIKKCHSCCLDSDCNPNSSKNPSRVTSSSNLINQK